SDALVQPSDIVKNADEIADLFSLDCWLAMVSRAYSRELEGAKLSEEDLVGEGSNAQKVAAAFEVLGIEAEFSVFRVASVLLRNAEVQGLVDEKSLKNFEKAFGKLNRLLEPKAEG
ncbi:MAG: hypothetical protein KDB07_11165, partial [Planctomycetes bacterium]|nr:hypothetical protein [Planctomycetota bacterium]